MTVKGIFFLLVPSILSLIVESNRKKTEESGGEQCWYLISILEHINYICRIIDMNKEP